MDGRAIVIDNGSYECRAGFSVKNQPVMRFRNIVTKSRSRIKETFVGAPPGEFDYTQYNIKSAFENNVVTQIDVQESVFDYIFSNLNITSSGIDYPIIMSEALFCPQQSRSLISELLFETYSANKLTYFVDGLASYYSNFGSDLKVDTMTVSLGYHTSQLIPISHGEYIPPACRRISIGGSYISWYLQKLLSLKYPCHADKFSITVAEDIVHQFGKVCENYREEMQRWKDEAYCQENTRTWSLRYSNETQRKAEELAERRQFQADRLREIHRKRTLDKMKEEGCSDDSDENQSYTCEVKRVHLCDDKNELEYKDSNEDTPPISESGIGGEDVLRKLANLRERKAMEFLSSLACPASVQAQITAAQPNTNQGLTEAKLKRRQQAASDLEARRGDDLSLWLSQINNTRQRISRQRTLRLSKVDLATELGLHSMDHADDVKVAGQVSAADRKQRKIEKIRSMTNELKSDRGKRLDNGRGGGVKKSTTPNTNLEDEDNWPDADVDEEEMVGLESSFSDDGEFDEDAEFQEGLDLMDTRGVTEENEETMSLSPERPPSPSSFYTALSRNRSRSRLRTKDAFDRLEEDAGDISECERDQLAVLDSVRAAYDPEFIKETGTVGLKVDVSEYYKIRLTTEPTRSTEVLFERSLLGDSQSGVGECLSWVLRDSSRYLFGDSASVNNSWVPRRLFLTGGPAALPGMPQRMRLELQQLLPWKPEGNPLDVIVAVDPSLDAWKGAQMWTKTAAENGFTEFTTRQVYEECGFDYLTETAISNRFYASLKDLQVNPKFNPGRGRQIAGVLPKSQNHEL
ncbi:unnamed protein product [Rodentolepis nana]|uniref:Actin-related protein 5 n=1 Tax=Rodentolepis nana TaxID=102285 RepID=A0A0R3TRD8_RODNA|nr:unnamed protein product [Rodentolepis nana]